MKNKLKTVILAVALIVIAVSAYATVAAFTVQDSVTNVITAGNIKIELKEMMISPEDDSELVPYVNNRAVVPGMEISKIVTVKNTGKNAAYVRVQIPSISVGVSGDDGYVLDEDLMEGAASLVTLDINTTDWTYSNGYYYYNSALASGAETTPLFTTVTFSGDITDEYENTQFALDVKVYAVQSANNGETVFDAAGWPEEI